MDFSADRTAIFRGAGLGVRGMGRCCPRIIVLGERQLLGLRFQAESAFESHMSVGCAGRFNSLDNHRIVEMTVTPDGFSFGYIIAQSASFLFDRRLLTGGCLNENPTKIVLAIRGAGVLRCCSSCLQRQNCGKKQDAENECCFPNRTAAQRCC